MCKQWHCGSLKGASPFVTNEENDIERVGTQNMFSIYSLVINLCVGHEYTKRRAKHKFVTYSFANFVYAPHPPHISLAVTGYTCCYAHGY